VPRTQYYAPPEKQLHQATKDEPWTDTLNSKDKVKAAFDSAWAAKMKDIVANYPELLQDKEAMNNIMAMREKGLQSLLGDWQETQFKSGLENFQRNLAGGDINRAMYEGYRDGLDPTMMKTLADPEWESSLVNFGGSQKIVSKNKRTGEFKVNGRTPTEADLKETMTEAQAATIGLQRERLAHDIARDAVNDARWEKQFAADQAYREATLADKQERTAKARDYSDNGNSNWAQMKQIESRAKQLKNKIQMYPNTKDPMWKYSRDEDAEYQQMIQDYFELLGQIGADPGANEWKIS
jgi:hypothetical protein